MARRRESGCPVHITLWSRLELLDEWPYYRPRLGRLATCHDSFRSGRRLTQTLHSHAVNKNRRGGVSSGGTARIAKPKPNPRWTNPTQANRTKPSRTCQSGPNTPQGLRLTQTKEPGVFFSRGTVALWLPRGSGLAFCCASCT
jgi:hypothetical protein